MKFKDVAIWGSIPPPLGGMTVHVSRLTDYLRKHNVNVRLYDFSGIPKNYDGIVAVNYPLFWYFGLLFGKSHFSTHYVITTRPLIRLLAVIYGIVRKKKIIIRVGGNSLQNDLEKGGISKLISRFVLKHCTVFIGVNSDITNLAKLNGARNAHTIAGFIAPDTSNVRNIGYTKNSTLQIVASGQIFAKSQYDIYGLYHMLRGIQILKQQTDINVQVHLFIYNCQSDEVLQEFKNEIKDLGLDEVILLTINSDKLLDSLATCHLYLRPSLTDGDCNTLREAMYFNKYVLASNSVIRPDSVHLYQNNDDENLAKELEILCEEIVAKQHPNYKLAANNAAIIAELI